MLDLLLQDSLLLLAALNPIGNIPIYSDLTKDMTPEERRRTLDLSTLVALVLVIAFSLIGHWALKNLFEVGLVEFQVAGGILLFVVALRGIMSGVESLDSANGGSRMRAVFPLAFPVLAGPGSLTVAILLSQKNGPLEMIGISLMTFAVVFLVARWSYRIMKAMGPYAGMIVPRLLYIFLAAKAVSMVLNGVVAFLKANL